MSEAKRRRISPADRALSDRLTAAGVPVEPRQLERWRVDSGVVELSDRPGAFDQACQVRQLLDAKLTLEQIAVVQFMRRRYVTTPALKRALRNAFIKTVGMAPEPKDWMEAQRLAMQQAAYAVSQWRRDPDTQPTRAAIQAKAGRPGERINEASVRVVTSVLMIATFGEAPTRRDLEELLAAGGLDVKNLAMEEIAKELQAATRDNLLAGLDAASRAELDQARDDCARANRVLTALSRRDPGA